MRRLNAVSHRECASPQTVGTIMITMKRSDEKERSIERSIKEKAARVTRSAKQIGGRSQGALVSSLYFCTTLVPYLSPPPSPISPLSSFASLITHSILTTSGVVWTGTSSGGPFVKVPPNPTVTVCWRSSHLARERVENTLVDPWLHDEVVGVIFQMLASEKPWVGCDQSWGRRS